jgi:hypothetical protein
MPSKIAARSIFTALHGVFPLAADPFSLPPAHGPGTQARIQVRFLWEPVNDSLARQRKCGDLAAVREEKRIVFMKEAILASVGGAFCDESP